MCQTSKKIQKCKVLANKMIAKDHFVMDLESKDLGKNAQAGHFVSIKVQENVTDPLLRIPLGVHKVSRGGISILYKVVGDGTRLLSTKKEGEEVSVLGPLGNTFDLAPIEENKEAEVVIASGGHGIAPLYVLAETIKEKFPEAKIHFLIGACTKEELLCVDDLKEKGLNVKVSTDDGTSGCRGYVTELIKELVSENDKKIDIIYSCGPRAMLAAVSLFAEKENIPAQVSLDAYMACGIGACLGCAIKTTSGYKLVCKDGPVFSSEEIVWREVKDAFGKCVCE